MSEYHSLPQPPNDETNRSPREYQQFNLAAEKRARECVRAPMPTLHHLTRTVYDVVYEPSEDTFLLLDAIRYDFDNNINNNNKDRVRFDSTAMVNTLEIGCGTGVATIYLAQLLQQQHQHHDDENSYADDTHSTSSRVTYNHYITDINPNAIRITLQTAQINHIPLSSIYPYTCHLATPLLQTHSHSMNIILFNPPYVPTPEEEVGQSIGIEASWAGGTHGRTIINQALPQIASLLSLNTSVAYMVVVDDNLPHDIATYMNQTFQITVIPYLRRRARNEFLTVLKMTRRI